MSVRDMQIAERITVLYQDALEEGETILADSMKQFTEFFLMNHDLGLPKIVLTPAGTMRVRWIQECGGFSAIEFTGKPLVKLVAEIPRQGGQTARHFSAEPVETVVSVARSLGAFVAP